jgi:hypothetical protein
METPNAALSVEAKKQTALLKSSKANEVPRIEAADQDDPKTDKRSVKPDAWSIQAMKLQNH